MEVSAISRWPRPPTRRRKTGRSSSPRDSRSSVSQTCRCRSAPMACASAPRCCGSTPTSPTGSFPQGRSNPPKRASRCGCWTAGWQGTSRSSIM